MNWLQRTPLWKQNEAWRARRAAMRADFEANSAALANAFTGAMSNQGAGMVELATKAATARISDQLSAKIAQAKSLKA